MCRAARARAGGASLETLAWQHGVTGVEEDILQGGKVVGRRLKRSDAVFRMILAGGESGIYRPAVKALREKLEKELRPRIEAEARVVAISTRARSGGSSTPSFPGSTG